MISLFDILPYEGSSAKSWEELAYQVRPRNVGVTETRKTKAPDGGVEWYELYSDGHHEGFQGKFYENLSKAIGDMGRSVRTVAADRPDMTVLTFVVPFDFTDTGGKTKSDQDRWTDAVTRWRSTIDGASRLDFRIIRGGDVLAELSKAEHAGRRAFWFGDAEISSAWMTSLVAVAKQVAGERYTPDAHTDTDVEEILQGLAISNSYIAETQACLVRLSAAMKTASWASRSDLIADLDGRIDSLVSDSRPVHAWAPHLRQSISNIRSALTPLSTETRSPLRYSADLAQKQLEQSLNAAEDHLANAATQAAESRELGLHGEAGQGKTHALLHFAEQLLQQGQPVITIMGEAVTASGWWAAIKEQLRSDISLDVFLSALSARAEASGTQGLIVIDGLNESQDARRWRTDLPSLRAAMSPYVNLSLLVTWRTDYRKLIAPPPDFPLLRHRGFRGNEREAIQNYARHYQIAAPEHFSVNTAFDNPLLLKLYCEVQARNPHLQRTGASRSEIFGAFVELRLEDIGDKLELSPARLQVVRQGLNVVCDLLLSDRVRIVDRNRIEPLVDALLPERTAWPKTLFASLVSAGLLEIRPRYDGTEVVSLPFQAFSEFVLCRRLLERLEADAPTKEQLADALGSRPDLWRPAATLLPELYTRELQDVLPEASSPERASELREFTLRSFAERSREAFSQRSLSLLEAYLHEPAAPDELSYIAGDVFVALSVRPGHPANADWLHEALVKLTMADRDASFGIMTYFVLEESDAFGRLLDWASATAAYRDAEHIRLSAKVLLWLESSPNRGLRDVSLRALVNLGTVYPDVLPDLIDAFRSNNDAYVVQRLGALVFGCLLRGCPPTSDAAIIESLISWRGVGLPVDVLTRDSLRGSAYALAQRGAIDQEGARGFDPPYQASPPSEPDTAKELMERHQRTEGGNPLEAAAIMHSCLSEWGDFNKYVVRSDVGTFSWAPLTGPPPASREDVVSADWAGRWIAQRAVSLGWTAEAFEAFEGHAHAHRGREGHKPERFGKKYQWIALHELLARLADNYHFASRWSTEPERFQGPWEWMGRDIDPGLPPSTLAPDGRRIELDVEHEPTWLGCDPRLDVETDERSWVGVEEDWPEGPTRMDGPGGRKQIALYRYSTWGRPAAGDGAAWDRRQWLITTSWLVKSDKMNDVLATLRARSLRGRWMPERRAITSRYFGEASWSPINLDPLATAAWEPMDRGNGDASNVLPAVEQYVWEGNVLDCSIDESVDVHKLIDLLMIGAEWDGTKAVWTFQREVIARAIRSRSEVFAGEHSALLCDETWLLSRLEALGLSLVIGTLGEKQSIRDSSHRARSVWSTMSQIASLDVTAGYQSEPLRTETEDNSDWTGPLDGSDAGSE